MSCKDYYFICGFNFLFISRKRRLVSHQNATSAVIITPSPAPAPVPFTQPPRPVLQPQPQYFAQPQMNYPPQQNYNNMYQSQPQVVMGSALPAYPQPSPMPTQQIYVLEPVPNEPVQQMGYLPSEQIYAPNPSEMKQKDYDEYKPV